MSQPHRGFPRSALAPRKGEFPQPVSLGPRSIGWLDHEVQAWIRSRAARRNVGVCVSEPSDFRRRRIARHRQAILMVVEDDTPGK